MFDTDQFESEIARARGISSTTWAKGTGVASWTYIQNLRLFLTLVVYNGKEKKKKKKTSETLNLTFSKKVRLWVHSVLEKIH